MGTVAYFIVNCGLLKFRSLQLAHNLLQENILAHLACTVSRSLRLALTFASGSSPKAGASRAWFTARTSSTD